MAHSIRGTLSNNASLTCSCKEVNAAADMPAVAIVIVDYNGFADTARCLESIDAVDYVNYTVYLVDNGGSHRVELESIASSHAGVCYLRSEDNLGFSGGNNFALEKVLDDFDYVLLLNNDTVVTPKFLSRLVEVADERTLVGPKIYYWADKDRIWYAGGKSSRALCKAWHEGFRKTDSKLNEKGPREVGFISGCCMLIPTKVLADVGLLDDSYFLYLEDTDYCFRAVDAGFALRYAPDSVIYHCVSASTGDASPLMNYYKLRNRQYFIDRYSTNKPLSKLLAYCEISIGLLIGKYKYHTVKKALCDYRRGIVGKMDCNRAAAYCLDENRKAS